MRRQIKKSDSLILKNNWKYEEGKDNSKIGEALLGEQNGICAYTETYLGGRYDSKDIEHFNPTLKSTGVDGYDNWFLVNHKLNGEKGSIPRWLKHQDILHPTAPDFEERVIYDDGTYIWQNGDKEAEHLIKYLELDDKKFVEERKLYIKNRKKSIERNKQSPEEYFQDLLQDEPERLKHIRAIEEEFKIKIQFNAPMPSKTEEFI